MRKKVARIFTGKVVDADRCLYLFIDFEKEDEQYTIEWDEELDISGSLVAWPETSLDVVNEYL